MIKKYLFLAGAGISLWGAGIASADDVTCYKENGEIEYQAGSPYHRVSASSDGNLVRVYFLKLEARWGDDRKTEILLRTFTHTRCTIKHSERGGIWK